MRELYQEFDENQLIIIDQGTDLGLSAEQSQVYADPKFSWEQMYEMQMGFVDGLSIAQVKSFANASMTSEEMKEKRESLLQEAGLYVNKDVLLEDKNVRDLLRVLKETGNEHEASEYMIALLKMDILSTFVREQGRTVRDLENQVQNLQNEKLRARATEVLEATKRDIKELKNNLIELKDKIKKGSKFLVETFKTSGKLVFYKSFEEFSGGLKKSFEALKHNNRINHNNAEKTLGKLYELRNELKSAQTHLKNFGRILVGRKPKTVEEDTHKFQSALLHSVILYYESRSKRLNSIDSVYDVCIEKMNSLNNSFSAKAKENKKDLKSLINEAAKEKKQNVHNNKSHNKDDRFR